MPPPQIDSYRFGSITIDGKTYNRDVIILPEDVLPNWWRTSGHSLQPGDLQTVLQATPQVLLVGQGAVSRMTITPEAHHALEEAGIELVALPTQEACQRYNELRLQRAVAAALHLTC